MADRPDKNYSIFSADADVFADPLPVICSSHPDCRRGAWAEGA